MNRWVSNHGMPDWIKRNEDINYLQEGRDKARAWTSLLRYNITHMVMDDGEIARCGLRGYGAIAVARSYHPQ